jgi:hypothetical protein
MFIDCIWYECPTITYSDYFQIGTCLTATYSPWCFTYFLEGEDYECAYQCWNDETNIPTTIPTDFPILESPTESHTNVPTSVPTSAPINNSGVGRFLKINTLLSIAIFIISVC